MPNYMRIRNKHHVGPRSPHVVSKKKISHARQRGKDAWNLHRKSIADNPYTSWREREAWEQGYLSASKFEPRSIPNRAPQGRIDKSHGEIVVKRDGPTRKLPIPKEIKEKPFNYYLGYIKPGKDGKPRRFFPRSNNPPQEIWEGRIANKSYKPEKDVESTT